MSEDELIATFKEIQNSSIEELIRWLGNVVYLIDALGDTLPLDASGDAYVRDLIVAELSRRFAIETYKRSREPQNE